MEEKVLKVISVAIEDIQLETSPPPSAGFIQSIKEFGIQQPPVLRIKGDGSGYMIVDGRRRIAAAIEADLKEIPAVIEDPGTSVDSDLMTLALNLQRSPNLGIEVDKVKRLIKKGLTEEELAETLGIPLAKLKRLFRLTVLCRKAEDMLKAGALSVSAALALARLPQEKQTELLSHGKVDLKSIGKAKREFALSKSKTLFDVGTDAEIVLNPLAIKMEEVAALIKATRRTTPEVEKAIVTLRVFAAEMKFKEEVMV